MHAGRSPQFECDHGFVGEAGVCVDWVPREDRQPLPPAERTPCGKASEPVCAGDMLNGAPLLVILHAFCGYQCTLRGSCLFSLS